MINVIGFQKEHAGRIIVPGSPNIIFPAFKVNTLISRDTTKIRNQNCSGCDPDHNDNQKKFRDRANPAHTARSPPATLATMYKSAVAGNFWLNKVTFSPAKVEKVVNPPQNPVTRKSFHS